jgi:hypothetical protein
MNAVLMHDSIAGAARRCYRPMRVDSDARSPAQFQRVDSLVDGTQVLSSGFPGMRLNERYDIGEVLGEGAFGRTVAARDATTGTDVVLKLITIRGLSGWKEFEYFEREVAVLRSLDHPGVPRFVDAFQAEVEGSGPVMALVMERIPGESLFALIQRGHRWEEARARALLESLLGTLDYLHGLSPLVIHRDIKPGNIMIRPDGAPVLVDFGAVRDWATRAGQGSLTVVGTPGYMAPEQAMGEAVPASDLFALGATMIHALTHCHPSNLPRRGLRLVFADRLGCSRPLVAVLGRMVEPDLAERYASASEVVADLHRPPEALVPSSVALAVTAPAGGAPPDRAERRNAVARRVEEACAELLAAPRPPDPAFSAPLARKARQSLAKITKTTLVALGALAMFCSTASPDAYAWLWFALMSPLIGSVAAIHWLQERRRLYALYQDGTATFGSVIYVSTQNMARGVYATVSYEYEVDGTGYRGTLQTGPAAGSVEVDDRTVLVIHDPAEPKRHLAALVRGQD